MIYCLLLTTLVVICNSRVSSELTIIIAEDGNNNRSCLNGSNPCRSLAYVLENFNTIPENNGVTLNITINDQHLDVLNSSIQVTNLTLIGTNTTEIYFQEQIPYIPFVAVLHNSRLMWQGLTVFGGTFNFSNFNEVIITDCIFQHFGGFVGSVSIIHISGSMFINNNLKSHLFSFTVPAKSDKGEMNIFHCNFSNNSAHHPLILLTNYEFYTSHEINISNTIFEGNKAPCLSVLGMTVSFSGKYVIENTTLTNNYIEWNITEQSLIYIEFPVTQIGTTSFEIKNVNFINNIMKSTSFTKTVSILSLISYNRGIILGNASFYNVRFSGNSATPLYIDNVNVDFGGSIIFENNTGYLGGGMRKNGGLLNIFDEGTNISFKRNFAILGGAVFISKNRCNTIGTCVINASIEFSMNLATTLGDEIYLEDPSCPRSLFEGECVNTSDSKQISTGPSSIFIRSINGSFFITLFPGQLIQFIAIVHDARNTSSSCIVQIILECGEELLVCKSNDGTDEVLKLNGDTKNLLTNDLEISNLYLSSSNEHYHTYTTPVLEFQCIDVDTHGFLFIYLTSCPLGYVFKKENGPFIESKQLGICECVNISNYYLKCDNTSGAACIKHGYWYGDIYPFGRSKNTSALCEYPYCRTNLQPCPIKGLSDSYDKLPVTQDEQCVGLNGGVLCKSCQKNAIFTFMAVKCIQMSSCKTWHYYIILIIAVVFQFLLGYLLLLALKTQLKIGSGYLYGPLFYLAVLGRIPFGLYKEFNALKITISIFQSIFLLNLEFFGEIQLCFFPSMNHRLYNYSLHFLGPTIIAIVLLGAVMLARRFPKQFLSIQSSPVQVICVLALLSFWSLITTCIEILKPIELNNEYRVSLEPELQYFKDPVHAVMSVVSLIVLLVIILPFIFILLFSPLLNYKFNLSRFQPILDELQSCYDDKFRWYSGIYLVSWIILNISMPFAIFTLCLILISSVHFIIHPYKSRWMNAVDSILLVDLILLAFLFLDISRENLHDFTDNVSIKDIRPVIYLLVLLPLLYVAIGSFWLASLTLIIWCKKVKGHIRPNVRALSLSENNEQELTDSAMQPLLKEVKMYDPMNERESLIRVVQELGEVSTNRKKLSRKQN